MQRSLDNLAGLYQSMGEYEKALPLQQQVIEITKENGGEEGSEYAQV